MGIRTLYSTASTVEKAIEEIKVKAEGSLPRGVIFFASSIHNPTVLSESIKLAFDGVPSIGCSTAGELVTGKMLTGSLVVMLLEDDILEDMHVELVYNVKTEDNIAGAFESLGNQFSVPVADMDVEKYVGLIMIDGMTCAEEKLMDTVGNLANISFIGGSAGDDLKFEESFVYGDGKNSSNAAVLGILKLKKGFDIIKTQSFCSLKKKLVATEVVEAERRVISFNDKPAAEAYAEAIGCSVEESADRFMHNPVGLMVNSEPYIRSPQHYEGADMVFYCNIKEQMELELMESKNIVDDTKQVVDAKIKELGGVSGIIDFHCILRTLELREKGQCEAYGKIFSDVPMVGYSTYGEEYIGHINQTSTMLIFK